MGLLRQAVKSSGARVGQCIPGRQGAAAKAAMQVRATPKTSRRPALNRIKERIAQASAVEPQLATAFREGTRQSDADLETLYDDLVLMGKIPDADDGR